jgi:hypothetical protein
LSCSFHASKSGATYAIQDGIRLHSSYDPRKEASRFVEGELSSASTKTVIVIGAGFRYVEEAIVTMYPGTRVLSFECSRDFANRHADRQQTNEKKAKSAIWYPGGHETPATFLRRQLDELSTVGIRILEWPASIRAFPSEVARIRESIAIFLRETNGNIMTVSKFGRRWIHNTLVNALSAENPQTISGVEGPVFIAASGSSLASCLSFLTRHRHRISLWALPSSLRFLEEHNLTPDIIVATDAGYYASVHLRFPSQHPIRIAMPITAAPPPPTSEIVLFRQDTVPEALIFEGRSMKPDESDIVSIPENGTVAGTALQIAVRSGAHSVIFGGLDLCIQGLIAHVRPHSFDEILFTATGRLKPLPSVLAARMIAAGGYHIHEDCVVTAPLRTFHGWFDRFCASAPIPIYRLNPSPIDVTGTIPVDPDSVDGIFQDAPLPRFAMKTPVTYPKSEMIPDRIDQVLGRWANDVRQSALTAWDEFCYNADTTPYTRPNTRRYPLDLIRYWDYPGLLDAYRRTINEGFETGRRHVREVADRCSIELIDVQERVRNARRQSDT